MQDVFYRTKTGGWPEEGDSRAAPGSANHGQEPRVGRTSDAVRSGAGGVPATPALSHIVEIKGLSRAEINAIKDAEQLAKDQRRIDEMEPHIRAAEAWLAERKAARRKGAEPGANNGTCEAQSGAGSQSSILNEQSGGDPL